MNIDASNFWGNTFLWRQSIKRPALLPWQPKKQHSPVNLAAETSIISHMELISDMSLSILAGDLQTETFIRLKSQ